MRERLDRDISFLECLQLCRLGRVQIAYDQVWLQTEGQRVTPAAHCLLDRDVLARRRPGRHLRAGDRFGHRE